MKDLLLIVNPNAGRNGYRDCLSEVLFTFHKCGWRTTTCFTDKHGDATRLAIDEGSRYSRIVCMGGDGTLSEVVTGIMHLPAEKRPQVGYVPMGTSNDSALTYGLSKDPVEAAYTAATGAPMLIDVGRFNDDRYFAYVAAFGAFTEVCYQTPQENKNALGWFAYIFDAMSRLPNLTHRQCRVEFDDGAVEGDFILCAILNARRFGGFIRLDNTAGISLSDGIFEVVLVRTPETILQVGPIFSDILANNFNSEYVMLFRTKRVRFTFEDPVSWTLDGEDGGYQTEVVCDNMQHSIHMIVNEDK